MHPHNTKLVDGKPSSHHKLYSTWKGMRERCTNPNHKDWESYGNRGIKVSERWNDFSLFVFDMGVRPKNKTLDRINNDKDYSRENCKWSTLSEQANNKRKRKHGIFRGAYKINTTGCAGVYPSGKKYRSVIFVNGKNKHLGNFDTIEDAYSARESFLQDNLLCALK